MNFIRIKIISFTITTSGQLYICVYICVCYTQCLHKTRSLREKFWQVWSIESVVKPTIVLGYICCHLSLRHIAHVTIQLCTPGLVACMNVAE